MDPFIVSPRHRTVVSYFLEDPAVQTIGAARSSVRAAPLPLPLTPPAHEPARLAVDIFCDGACLNNGRRGARGGYGMVARQGSTELVAVSEPLSPAEPQTNQRAELRGLGAALTYAETAAGAGATTVRIYTDSEYAINCLTRWSPAWRRAGWRKAGGEPVLHRDLLEPLCDKWGALRGVAFLNHVAAHTGRQDLISLGNERADGLARAALSRADNFFL
jgi:ribonuclease HI